MCVYATLLLILVNIPNFFLRPAAWAEDTVAAADVDVGGDGGAVAKEKREIPFHFEGDFQFWTLWPETGFGKQISKDGEVWQTLKQVNVSRLVKRNEKEKGVV